MVGRNDVLVGVGGEGGISYNGTIFPDVGGYLPIIEQGMTTVGYCRYRQAIPVGKGGQLDIDTNYGILKAFLPQGKRRYVPIRQPTAQQVLINVISEGPTTVFLIGAHTNFALFLMHNPHLKKNVEHIYIMGGGVRSSNPTGCCPTNATTTCRPEQCGDPGNLFTDYTSNPYAEFNMFVDPFAAYQVIHSGIPITLVPLDATNSIPITKEFFKEFELNQKTYEAQYCFKSLKMTRDTYFMWDSFMAGVAVSIMSKPYNSDGENEFAEMKYMNITVRTSNKPYGINDGSNPLFDERNVPKFGLTKDGVHSGHVQRSVRDPFCLVKNGKGKCQDGYTEEVTGKEGVRVLVATRAKPNKDPNSFESSSSIRRVNLTTQFPHYKEVLYKPDFRGKKIGKPIVFDMDMSVGDFLALFYLLEVPVEVLNLKQAIPHGSGGLLDSDTLYGLARALPRSPRRYTAENSVEFGAPRNTENPTLRQPLALEIWENVTKTMNQGTKITILTSGPLTTLSQILSSDNDTASKIQDVFVLGENVFEIPWNNKQDDFNMFLDPLSAKMVFESKLPITLITSEAQQKASKFSIILERLSSKNTTAESSFIQLLISRLISLQKEHHQYKHV
ncbi:Non-specific ribonucleoside hydrolase RihC, partial [Bienertia sinuspersici]